MTKCPHCEKLISSLLISELPGNVSGGVPRTFVCLAYSCPFCRKAITVGIDPIAVMNDTIDGIKRSGLR